MKVAQQSIEAERLYSALQESEEKLRSETEKLKQDYETEISGAMSEVCLHMYQLSLRLILINENFSWRSKRQKTDDCKLLCKLPLSMPRRMPNQETSGSNTWKER